MIEKEIEIKTSKGFYSFLNVELIKYNYKTYTSFRKKQQIYINVTDNKGRDLLIILRFSSMGLFNHLYKSIRQYDIKKQIEENK